MQGYHTSDTIQVNGLLVFKTKNYEFKWELGLKVRKQAALVT